jgi:hypothetical protein
MSITEGTISCNLYPYQTYGTVRHNDPTYVIRCDVEEKLQECLINKEYCSILASKQMGKTTLGKKMSHFLREHDFITLFIDLQSACNCSNINQLYLQIIGKIRRRIIDIDISPTDYNSCLNSCTSTEFPTKFEELLINLVNFTKKNIVIFFDEIDTLRITSDRIKEPLVDNFLQFIRYCFMQRDMTTELNNIAFCLIGTGEPNDFIVEKGRISFNIGTEIQVRNFLYEEAETPLISSGLQQKFGHNAKSILKQIFKWTNGQPCLTQCLCKFFYVTNFCEELTENIVDKKIEEQITKNSKIRQHLDHIEDSYNYFKEKSMNLLNTYKDILDGKNIKFNSKNKAHRALKITGLIVVEDNYMRIGNLIYKTVFNLNWVNEELTKLRFYAENYKNFLSLKEQGNGREEKELLYGAKFDDAWTLKEQLMRQDPNSISGQEMNFLCDSEKFWENAQGCLPNSDYKQVIDVIMDWTGGLKVFNDFIFSLSQRYRTAPIDRGKEEAWVKELLQTHLFSKKLDSETSNESEGEILKKHRQKVKEHLQKIEKEFIDYPNPSSLLLSYQEILNKGEVEFNYSEEHQKLIDMCLVIQEDNKLRILNKIYPCLFNQEWITKLLSSLCPYTHSFKQWQDSGCQDESYLLKGEDLQKVLNWIQDNNKSLDDQENQFIISSLVWNIWSSPSNTEADNARENAVNLVLNFQKDLKEKINFYLLQYILEKTKVNSSLLEKLLNGLVTLNQTNIQGKIIYNEETVEEWLKNYLTSPITGINYEKLDELLKNQQWKEADEMTRKLILNLAKRENFGWLEKEDILQIPTYDIEIINDLWIKHSQGHFGFSVQTNLYIQAYKALYNNNSFEYDLRAWNNFCNDNSWQQDGRIVSYENFNFTLNANRGHLPSAFRRIFLGTNEIAIDFMFRFFLKNNQTKTKTKKAKT